MSTILDLRFNGASGSTTFTDDSSLANTITAHGSAHQTGDGSVVFDSATASNVTLTQDSHFDFASNDFTIRFSVNLTSFTAGFANAFFDNGEVLAFFTDTGVLTFYDSYTYPAVALNTSYEISIECYAGNLYVYYNGVQQNTAAALSQPVYFAGGDVVIGSGINGTMDWFLIDNGVALAGGASSYALTAHDYTDIINMITVGDEVEIHLNVTDAIDISGFLPETRDYTDEIAGFQLTGQQDSYLGHETVEILNMGLQLNSQYAYEVYIAPNWISRHFTAKLGDLDLPISAISATLSASGGSNVTLTVQGITSALLDSISTRTNQPIVVKRTYKYSDGSSQSREFIRVNYETVSSDQGAKSGTVQLSGRKYLAVSQSKDVTVKSGYVKSLSQGKWRYRLPVHDEINLGDVLHIDNTFFVVGRITYAISLSNEFMECQEYVADGTDTTGIGTNARPTPLQEYPVFEVNPKYFLWQAGGYLHNGRAFNPADPTNYPYSLWYDSTGALWYAAGFPVYESDGVTQATINV